ncbi:uncharacterized protein DS421_12g384870 [Arachis hypogaea]|nr:uncharacterized protein DS421_12g384870 [Arachis hypogaea]
MAASSLSQWTRAAETEGIHLASLSLLARMTDTQASFTTSHLSLPYVTEMTMETRWDGVERQCCSSVMATRWQLARMATATHGADGDKASRRLLFFVRLTLFTASSLFPTPLLRDGSSKPASLSVTNHLSSSALVVAAGWVRRQGVVAPRRGVVATPFLPPDLLSMRVCVCVCVCVLLHWERTGLWLLGLGDG